MTVYVNLLLNVLLLILYCLTKCAYAEEEEKYVINFDSSVFVCGDENSAAYFDTSQVEVTRYNETNTWMFGAIGFLEGINANTLVEIYIEKDSSGRYEPLMSHDICDICEELHGGESVYYKYLKNIDFPRDCPIQPGIFNIENFVLYTEYLPVSKATEGRYQVTVNFYSTPGDCLGSRTFLGCLKVDVVVEPE